MSSAQTTTTKKIAKKATEAAVPVTAPTSVPVEESKKVVKKAASTTSTPAPVVSPVVAAVVTEPSTETTEVAAPSLADEIKALQDQLTAIRDSASTALATLKRIAKSATKEIKEASKKKRRARVESADGEAAKPSNFTIPLPISDELSVFLGGGKNNQMSRAQVKSAIHKYINDKNLRVKHDITPDAPLRKLLAVDSDVKLTIFNIQTYLSRHFPKAAAATTA